ncbi:MAG: hypothetical protein QNJ64_09795 [Crocosphaera sp.]|nr:hypothetical protein [Crocosphaera sp.]
MARRHRHPSIAFHPLERGGLEPFFSVNQYGTSQTRLDTPPDIQKKLNRLDHPKTFSYLGFSL